MAKIVSLNVNGLNFNVKRSLLLTNLKSLKADIVFIQETHFNCEGSFAFNRRLYPTAYLAFQDMKKAGVAILISRSCPIQIVESIIDPNGRFIILRTTYQGIPVTLCNVYVPNTSQISFLSILLSKLSGLPPSTLIIGGDFNVAFF